jgi:hypothetical protein
METPMKNLKVEGEYFSLTEGEGYGDLQYKLSFGTFGLGCEIFLDEATAMDLMGSIQAHFDEEE